MSDEPLIIEPRVTRWRYLFSDGHVLDVVSPYRADSNDRDEANAEADRRWGKAERRIEGVAWLDRPEPPAPKPKKPTAKKAT